MGPNLFENMIYTITLGAIGPEQSGPFLHGITTAIGPAISGIANFLNSIAY